LRRRLALLLVLCVHGSTHAGAWTQPAGKLWIKSAFIYLLTDQQYASTAAILPGGRRVERGDRRPFDDDGATRMRALWTEAEYGVTERLTLGMQLPWYDLRYEDQFSVVDSWGVGDIRFVSRVALLNAAHRLSVRGAWKLPVGAAQTDPDDIPVSEGQADLEAGLQYGRGLFGRPLSWIGLEGGYRWRLRDAELGRDPGDEWFWRVEAGWSLLSSGGLGLRATWDGLRGGETLYDDFGALPGNRSFDAITTGLLVPLGAWLVEPLVSFTVSGEAYPAGESLSLSVSRAFQLPKRND